MRQKAESARQEREKGSGNSTRVRKESWEVDAAFASVKALVGTLKGRENHGDGVWIVDFGGSHHLCYERHLFESLKRIKTPTPVPLGDGSALLAIRYGRISIRIEGYSLRIQVLCFPGLMLGVTYAVTYSNRLDLS